MIFSVEVIEFFIVFIKKSHKTYNEKRQNHH